MLEEALNNPNYPPAEAARALLSYLSNELPTGPEAEYRFCQVLYPLTVSRVFGPLGPFDAQFRHGAGGWLSRSARWGVGGAGGGGGSSASSRTSHGRNVVSSASARLHQLHVPGGVGIGSSIGSAAALSSDPVVQLLSVSPPPSSRTSGSSHGGMLGGRGSQRGSGSAGGRGQQQRQPPSTLIDVISEETEHRPAIHLSFPFLALPELDWRLLLQLVELNCGANGPITEGTDNGRRLYGSLLRVTPLEQRGVVRLYQEITFQLEKDRQEQQQRQQQAVAMGSPPSYSSPQSMPMWQQQQQQQQQQGFSPQPMQQSPAGQQTQTQQQQQQQEQQNPVQKAMSETVLLLTMWEFYFFLFARYPFFKPSSSSSSTSSNGNTRAQSTNQSHQRGAVAAPYTNPSTHARSPSSSNVRRGGGSSYGDAVYSHLFAVYVRHYLPHRRTSANPTGAMPLTAPAPLSEGSEVFLGITIDYWLEGENVLLLQRQQRHRRAEEQLRRQRHHQNGGGVPGVGVGLAGAYDDAQLPDDGGKSYYHPTPPLVARGLRYLVGHVASDPAVQSAVLRWNGTVGVSGATGGADQNGSAATGEGGTEAAPSDSPPCWCLTPASTALQQPILNYVRLAFRYAPFHSNDSPFYTALDMWLTWLEPWNLAPRRATFASGNLSKDRILNQITASMGSHTTSAAPKPTAPSKYTALWEPYIAANVHLYTTPLAVFLRRAKDFDFSPRDFRRSLTTVQKVFRVFSPQVVQAINDVLGETSPAPLSSLRVQHEQNLGEFCPPDPISLSTTGPDVHNLLEEMYFQHDKKLREFDFLDRMDDRLQNMSGSGTKSERTAIDRVREGGRVIAGFPADYDASSGGWEGRQRGAERLAGAAGAATAAPERVTNGIFLTENGREQVLTGRRLFHPEDVKFLGDPMNARVKSYEIGFLVHWCNFVSCWLNERLGLVPTDEANAGRSKDGGEDATPVMLRLVREGEESKKVWFRINLRFLADYRNLVFFAVVATMVKLFRSMF